MKQITRRFPSDRIQSPRPRVFTPDWLQRLIKYADLPSSESHQTSSDRGAGIVAQFHKTAEDQTSQSRSISQIIRRSCFHRCRQWHRHIWLHDSFSQSFLAWTRRAACGTPRPWHRLQGIWTRSGQKTELQTATQSWPLKIAFSFRYTMCCFSSP